MLGMAVVQLVEEENALFLVCVTTHYQGMEVCSVYYQMVVVNEVQKKAEPKHVTTGCVQQVRTF